VQSGQNAKRQPHQNTDDARQLRAYLTGASFPLSQRFRDLRILVLSPNCGAGNIRVARVIAFQGLGRGLVVLTLA
jgi:hypothetical protein